MIDNPTIHAKVPVVEQETGFRDRVRGEGMHSWGVAEAKRLGVYDLLLASCGREADHWITYTGGRADGDVRVLPQTGWTCRLPQLLC